MTEHACDWCHRGPTVRVVIERAVYSGTRLMRRPIYAYACATHEHLGLAEDQEAGTLPANTLRRRKDRTAVQLEMFPDERAADSGAYET